MNKFNKLYNKIYMYIIIIDSLIKTKQNKKKILSDTIK
jgi:hypothetical protein